jgi:hypothetical protein
MACSSLWLGRGCQPSEPRSEANADRAAAAGASAVASAEPGAGAAGDEGRLPGMPAALTPANFELIKRFVLRKGDRQTYCSMYNQNPHFRFEGFDVYLNPDVGQQNINCDPALSDFDELVVHDERVPGEYFSVKLDKQRRALVTSRGAVHVGDAYFAEMLRVARAKP